MSGGVSKPDWIVGRDFIKVGGGDVTVVGEFAFVPASAGDPFAGFAGGHALADHLDGFADFADLAELDAIERGGLVKVAMGVNQAGSGGAAVQINDAGGFGSALADLFVAADRDDFP